MFVEVPRSETGSLAQCMWAYTVGLTEKDANRRQLSNRATREVESRTPKREPIVKVASRKNEQFVNVGAIKFHKGSKRKKKAWPLVGVVPEEERSKRATPIATGISNI